MEKLKEIGLFLLLAWGLFMLLGLLVVQLNGCAAYEPHPDVQVCGSEISYGDAAATLKPGGSLCLTWHSKD